MKHGMKIINGQRLFTLEFTDGEMAVLQEGLMHVPYGRAAPVINSINEQLAPPKSADQPDTATDLGYHRAGSGAGP